MRAVGEGREATGPWEDDGRGQSTDPRLARGILSVSIAILLGGLAYGAVIWRGAAEKDGLGTSGLVVHTLPPIIADQTTEVQHVFAVRNPSNRSIRILDIVKSCSCTDATIGSRELGPREETELTMKVNLRDRSGLFGTECTLTHDGGPATRYKLEVPIYRRVEFLPNLIVLGRVEPGVERETEFTVIASSLDGPPLAPVLFVKGLDRTQVHLELEQGRGTVRTLSDGVVQRETPVRLRLTPPQTAGPGRCRIVTDLAPNSYPVEGSLRVEWFIDAPYEMTPKQAFFGEVGQTAGKLDCEVRIQHRERKPFRVTSVRSNIGAVTCSCATAGSLETEHVVVLTLAAAGFDRFLYGEAVVETDDPAYRRLKIPIAASR